MSLLRNILIIGEAEHIFEGDTEKFDVFPKISNCTSVFCVVSFICRYGNSTDLGQRSLRKLIPSLYLASSFFSCLLKRTCSKRNVVNPE